MIHVNNIREACKMSKVDVVIGCFYGDEGKGKVICRCHKYKDEGFRSEGSRKNIADEDAKRGLH